MALAYTENTGSQIASGPASESTNGKSRASLSTRLFKWFMILAIIALSAEIIWFLGITPFMPFSKITVSGFSSFDHDSLLQYAGITPESSFIFTSANEIENLISALPQVETVKVYKRFPGKLEIFIQSRKPSAVAFAYSGGVTVPVLFDRQGVIYQIGADNMADPINDMPVLSGLVIEQPYLGMRLPSRFLMLLEELDTVRINAPELLSAVSEIRIDKRSAEGFDLTLYLIHHKIKVRVSGLSEDLLRYTLLVADVLSVNEPEIDMVDFRGAVASYFPKGGSL